MPCWSVIACFQEYLSAFRKEEEERGAGEWCSVIVLRCFTNLLILGLLSASAYLIWYISVSMSLGVSRLYCKLCQRSAVEFLLVWCRIASVPGL